MLNQKDEAKSAARFHINSPDELLSHLMPMLDEQPDMDENLLDYGLTSIDLMKLVADLRDVGVRLSFEDLARSLSIEGIWKCIMQTTEKCDA